MQLLRILNQWRPEKHQTSTDLENVGDHIPVGQRHCLSQELPLLDAAHAPLNVYAHCRNRHALNELWYVHLLFAMQKLWRHQANTFPAEPGCTGPTAISHHGVTRLQQVP